MNEPPAITIETLADRADVRVLAEFDAFLSQASNGALFHERAFLAYHPKNRFAFSHLVARNGKEIAALFPGGCQERSDGTWFRSPLGASFGGPVLSAKMAAREIQAVLCAIQNHALRESWRGIELVPPPTIYRNDRSQALDYCLADSGFSLSHRLLGHAVPLDGISSVPTANRFADLFRSGNIKRTRAARRNGVTAELGGLELLKDFASVFDDTYARHQETPTHSLVELSDLMTRLPDRFRIAIARKNGVPAAGLFLMLMNASVANSFYICSSTDLTDFHGGLVAFAHAIDILAKQGYRWLDLGPSSMANGKLNSGVAFYKEGLGAIGYCRDHWTWIAQSSAGQGRAT